MGNSEYQQHVRRIERRYDQFIADKEHILFWEVETLNRDHPFYNDRYHHIIWNRFHFDFSSHPPYDKIKNKNYTRNWGRGIVQSWIKEGSYPKD